MLKPGGKLQAVVVNQDNICGEDLLQDGWFSLHTPHVGAVDDGFAPHAAAVVFVGSDAKLIVSVGF